MSASAAVENLPLEGFQPVGLDALNAKAEMLERLDNKYVVTAEVLAEALVALQPEFEVLEIDGRRTFTYDTCYFDGANLPCYFDHHQGRRRRAKVRMRSYAEAGLCFVEVKLKDKRGVTVKRRLKYRSELFGVLDRGARQHIRESYSALYGRDFPYELQRVLDMRYRRTTLVAREGGERMTIDSELAFEADGFRREVDAGLFIIETKSANGNGLADRVLRSLHQHPTAHCSKYCVATALLNRDVKRNKFLAAIRSLGTMALPAMA